MSAANSAILNTFSLSGTDLSITGVNVHILDGTGKTASPSGLGNLIIGYNKLGNSNGDIRTGSHNLVLGDQNNYASFGGLVAGQNNGISGLYSSVSGGDTNTANFSSASVSGGTGNTANFSGASVSGGTGNTANSDYASVSGGNHDDAFAEYGWKGGGYHSP